MLARLLKTQPQTADRRPQTADRRPQTADRRPQQFILTRFLSIAIFLAIAMIPSIVSAQSLARFVFPDSSNNTNISVNPFIQIQTTYRIDHSSIVDSTTANLKPSVYVIDEDTYLNVPDSLWYLATAPSSFSVLTGDTTLQFAPSLNHSTNYFIVLKGLRVIDNTNDTLSVSQISLDFSTIPPLAKLLNFNSYLTINCSDTLKFSFNVPIDSLTTSAGDLILVHRVIGTTFIDSTHVTHIYDTLSTTMWFNSDSTQIFLRPDSGGFQPGNQFLVHIFLSQQTGDSNDDISSTVHVSNLFNVSIDAKPTISTDSLDGDVWFYPLSSGFHSFNIDDTVVCMAPKYVGNYTFDKWSIDSNKYSGQIDVFSDTLLITKDCSNLTDIQAWAYYKRIPKDTIVINDTSGISINVYNNAGDSLGGAGTYFVNREGPDTLLRVYAASVDTNTWFYSWISGNSYYNNSTNQALTISGGNGNATLVVDKNHGGGTNCSTYKVSVDGYFLRYSPTLDVADYVTVTPALGVTTYGGPTTVTVTITIKDISDCYRIDQIFVDDVEVFFAKVNNTTEDDGTLTYYETSVELTPGKKCASVKFRLRKKRYFAEFEVVEKDGNALMDEKHMWQSIIPPNNPSGMDNYPIRNLAMEVESYTRDAHKIYWKYLIECGTVVTLVPKLFTVKANAEYEFYSYNSGSGYYSGSSPTTSTLVIVMDQNYTALGGITGKKIQAKLRNKNFRISLIGLPLTESDPTILSYYDPNVFPWGKFVQLTPGVAPEMVIEFTKPVNVATVNMNTLFCKDEDFRLTDYYSKPDQEGYDGPHTLKYFPSSVSGNYYWETGNKRLHLFLETTDVGTVKYLPPWGKYSFTATTSIRSAAEPGIPLGIALNTDYSHGGFTEVPTCTFQIVSQSVGSDVDELGDSEVFSYLLGSIERTITTYFRLPGNEFSYYNIRPNQTDYSISPPKILWQRKLNEKGGYSSMTIGLGGIMIESDGGTSDVQTSALGIYLRSKWPSISGDVGVAMANFTMKYRYDIVDSDFLMGHTPSGAVEFWSGRRYRTHQFPETVFVNTLSNPSGATGFYGWNVNVSITY